MTIEKGRLHANGLNFALLADGPKGGPLVLLLHGFPEGKESYKGQLEALAEAGYRAVAPDLRGYGGSDAPQGVEAYAMPHLLADVRGMIHALGEERVHLVGHDWGALVGWPFVSRHPEMVRSWTSLSIPHPTPLGRASGLDGSGQADPDQQARSSYVGLFQKAGKAEELLLAEGAARLRAMLEMSPTGVHGIPEAQVAEFVSGFQRPGRLSAALNYYRANLRPQAYAAFPPAPNPITAPTLLIWGDQDMALGRRAVEETAQFVAGPYRLEVLEGAGHWLQFERGEDVSRRLIEHLHGVRQTKGQ